MDDRAFTHGEGQGTPDAGHAGGAGDERDGPAGGGTHEDTGWYVVRCKAREDARAVEHLGNQGLRAFSPSCVVLRRVGTVRRRVTEPLFPGYAFVLLSPTRHDWSVLRSTRGVLHLVRFGMHAPQVPPAVVEQLRALDGVELGAPVSRLKVGDRVRVLDGPFTGMEGVLQHKDGETRACVLLECMQRLMRVTVPGEALAPVR